MAAPLAIGREPVVAQRPVSRNGAFGCSCIAGVVHYSGRDPGLEPMSRLFISHSSKDNAAARAFKQWLAANGWPDEDVFLDLDDIGAGERWKDALRKANLRCEAVILLASSDALSSPECLAEVRKAEDYGKEIIVVLLGDLQVDDRRLDAYKERQIVDLATEPQNHVEIVDDRGERREIHFSSDALAKVKDYLWKRGIAPDHFAWPPANKPDAEPFPGLSAFGEDDAGIFFGRDADILRGLDKLRVMRRDGYPRTLVIQAASGAGKSSYLRAGLWPRLRRAPDFAALAVLRPANGILTGPDGLGQQLAHLLSEPGRLRTPGDIHAALMAADEKQASAAFNTLMGGVVARAVEQRSPGNRESVPPALVLAIDQAEELFAPDDEAESERFLVLMAKLVRDPPRGVAPIAIFTVRSDGAVRLFQMLTEHKLEPPETLPLLPLSRTSYRDVILKPLEVASRRGHKVTIGPELADRLVEDSFGADAMPLLALTLSHLYRDFGTGGTITLQQYEALGGVARSIDLALKRAFSNPGGNPAIPSDKKGQMALLRTVFIPWLARISSETGLPARRVERLDKFSGPALGMVERLIEARLLVADRREGTNVVEIAHESILRQWQDLKEWLKDDGDNLKAVEGVEWAAGEWQRSGRQQDRLEHRGARLRAAWRIASREDFRKRLGPQGLDYLAACRAGERRRTIAFGSVVGSLVAILVAGGLAWHYEPILKEKIYWLTEVRSYVLSAGEEAGLKPLESFRECSDCPDMVVIPAGTFEMGAPQGQGGKDGREYPPHTVTISSPFAVGKTPVTFAQFTACAEHGDCDPEISSNTRDDRPAINVTWLDAQQYAAWLARITGKPYRLLSEAEYEYAARGGTQSPYPWGDRLGTGNANCLECGGDATNRGTTPVGLFPANGFGLHDMVGNVYQWVADCYHANYRGAPADGAAWVMERCPRPVVRGASWLSRGGLLRSSWRDWRKTNDRKDDVGFRIARPLDR
jgi:formylglycine-generating enzyme required for sulfatase activity